MITECMTGVLRNRTMNRPCYLSQPLLTITYPDEVQHSIFSFSYDKEESVLVPRPFVSMTTFTVDKFKDIGGTLSLDLMMNQIDKTFDKVRWSSSEDQVSNTYFLVYVDFFFICLIMVNNLPINCH